MTGTGFRKLSFFSYSLQCTSHDFENNKKTMLTEKNQSLHSWVVSQPPPYAHKSQPAAVVTRRKQQEATTHCGIDFENQRYFDFNEGSYSDSTGRSEILR